MIFRQFIQALFVTHGETNLNPIGHLISKNNKSNHDISTCITLPRVDLFRKLLRRSNFQQE